MHEGKSRKMKSTGYKKLFPNPVNHVFRITDYALRITNHAPTRTKILPEKHHFLNFSLINSVPNPQFAALMEYYHFPAGRPLAVVPLAHR